MQNSGINQLNQTLTCTRSEMLFVPALASQVIPAKDATRVKDTFNAFVSDVLSWRFVPQQRKGYINELDDPNLDKKYIQSDLRVFGVGESAIRPAMLSIGPRSGHHGLVLWLILIQRESGSALRFPGFFWR